MRRLCFSVRLASLTVTAVYSKTSKDPIQFTKQVLERLRQSGLPVSRFFPQVLDKVVQNGPTEFNELVVRGEYSQAVAELSNGRRIPFYLRGKVADLKQIIQRLKREPLKAQFIGLGDSTELRVLHVLTNSLPYTNSGYTVRSHNVLLSQLKAGIDARALTRPGYPVVVGKVPQSSEQLIDGIRYLRALPWVYEPTVGRRDAKFVKAIVEEAKNLGATILHTTTDFSNALVVSEAADRLGIPWVYEARGELENTWLSKLPMGLQRKASESEFYIAARRAEEKSMNASAAVVVLSEVSKQSLVKRGIPAEKIFVVPNGIDEDYLTLAYDKNKIKRELELDVDSMYVGTVSAIVGYEGLDVLIDAVQYLPSEWKVLIVGEGTELPNLRRKVKEAALEDRVSLVGRKAPENIWKWYAALDVFALPRVDMNVTRTVTPIKPVMALALGIPVVASDLPAIREVTGGYADYVTRSPKAIANAVVNAKVDRSEVGRWLKQRTWRENGKKYKHIYQKLVSARE